MNCRVQFTSTASWLPSDMAACSHRRKKAKEDIALKRRKMVMSQIPDPREVVARGTQTQVFFEFRSWTQILFGEPETRKQRRSCRSHGLQWLSILCPRFVRLLSIVRTKSDLKNANCFMFYLPNRDTIHWYHRAIDICCRKFFNLLSFVHFDFLTQYSFHWLQILYIAKQRHTEYIPYLFWMKIRGVVKMQNRYLSHTAGWAVAEIESNWLIWILCRDIPIYKAPAKKKSSHWHFGGFGPK